MDPACGSGHFLIAASHRIAKRLAAVRTGDEEPSPTAVGTALRDVIGHSIYGVDWNPMAVELCKVNVWMEALEPGKPLSFLEHRIQWSNALLGATPALVRQGIPDAAFHPIEGDSREASTKWKRVNKAERTSWEKKQGWLGFDAPVGWLMSYATGLASLDAVPDDSIERVREKERRHAEAILSSDYLDGKFLADAWCATFVWKKDSLTESPITEQVFRQIEKNRRRSTMTSGRCRTRSGGWRRSMRSCTGTWRSRTCFVRQRRMRRVSSPDGMAGSTWCWAIRLGSGSAAGEGVVRGAAAGDRRCPECRRAAADD